MQVEDIPTKVLLIRNDEKDFRLIRDVLSRNHAQKYELQWVANEDAGLAALAQSEFDVCLLDSHLVTMSGLDLLKEAISNGCAIPVIFLTGIGDHGLGLEAMRAGAADYLVAEELNGSILERSIRYSIDRIQLSERLRKESERRRLAETSLKEQVRFETVLAEISARFVNLVPDQVDFTIEEAQRIICSCLGLDRSTLWQAPSPGSTAHPLTHLYQPADGAPVVQPADPSQLSSTDWAMQSPEPIPLFMHIQGEAYFPWMGERLKAGQVVLVSKVDDLPVQASVDKEFLHCFGTKSTAVFPLTASGVVMGCIAFDAIREERDWPESLVKQLDLVSQIFANAIARAQADRAVRESEERLSLAAASANAGMWSIDVSTWNVWATAKAREIFGVGADEEVSFEFFLQLVHPEDRDMIRETVLEAIQSGQDVSTEYRVVLADGTMRWIASRGRIHRGCHGEADRLMGISADVTDRKRMEEQLEARLRQIEQLKKELEQENIHLREEVKLLFPHDDIAAKSEAMRRILLQVEQVASTNSTVLITGETGSGKGLIAHAIHQLSSRNSRPLVTVNCASLPPTLIESELFGREKGAYTGAMSRMVGRFEVADGATIFLDEIAELPMEVQGKLLRILESGHFERLGSTKTLKVNVRLIAATNRDFDLILKEGRFRSDLYYRLNVFPIKIPPLRERVEDIPILAWTFVRQFEQEMGTHIESIPKRSMETLRHYSWPGNVRELRNIIERAMIGNRSANLEVVVPSSHTSGDRTTENRSLQNLERQHILQILQETGWRIAGRGGAAEILGLKPTTLEARLKRLGICRPKS